MHNKVPFHLLAEIHEIENNLVDSRNETRECHFILAAHIFFWFIQIFVFFFFGTQLRHFCIEWCTIKPLPSHIVQLTWFHSLHIPPCISFFHSMISTAIFAASKHFTKYFNFFLFKLHLFCKLLFYFFLWLTLVFFCSIPLVYIERERARYREEEREEERKSER